MLRISISVLAFLATAVAIRAEDEIGGKSIKQLQAALLSNDVRTRYQALVTLHEAGIEAKPMVPALGRALRDPHPVIRRGAAETLANLKEDAAPAVPALMAALRDSDPGVRQLAGQAITEIGEAATEPLLKMLDDKDSNVRLAVVQVMAALNLKSKSAMEGFGRAAKDLSPSVRRAALFALSKTESDDVYALLGEALRDKEQNIRQFAANALINLGRGSTSVLSKSTDDPAVTTRLLAMHALAALGENLEESGIMALRKGLEDKDPRVRQAAATGIANQGPRARPLGGDKEMFQAVAKLLQEKDVATRRAAMLALGKMGSSDFDEIKEAAVGLKDKDVGIRTLTVQALNQFLGEKTPDDARKFIHQQLIETLRDSDQRLQLLAAQALFGELDGPINELIKTVEKGSGSQRLWAATILGELGGLSTDAIPALQKMSRDANSSARHIATTALKKIQQ